MLTKLSVNLNKIALLRNSRGRDYPNVLEFADKFIELGAHGITIHPRQDQRHITNNDAYALGELLSEHQVELNIEGYPSDDFLELVANIKPTQCTLVPDSPNQLTSDHGWDLTRDSAFVKASIDRLKKLEVRTALFLDPDIKQIELVPNTGADRIELYTESYADTYGSDQNQAIFESFKQAVACANKLGIGVNAGHDLDITNLAKFLTIDGVLEVSIGHALMVECIEMGMESVVKQYLKICGEFD